MAEIRPVRAMFHCVFDAINAELVAGGGLPVENFEGAEFAYENAAPPRFVWYQTEDSFEEPERPGGNPEALLYQNEGWEVLIWGAAAPTSDLETHKNASTSTTWILKQLLLKHLKLVARKSQPRARVNITLGTWVNSRDGNVEQHGTKYLLTGQLQTKVDGTTFPEAVITDINSTTYIVLGGAEIAACCDQC